MNAKQAIKELKNAGFALVKVRANGCQKWVLGTTSVVVPAKSQLEESGIRRAVKAAQEPAAIQVCAIRGCRQPAAVFSNKCGQHWHAQAQAFPQGC